MSGTDVIIIALIFAMTTLTIMAVFYFFKSRKELHNQVETIKHEGDRQYQKKTRVPLDTAIKQYLTDIIGSLGNRVKPKEEGELSHMQKMFLRAGYRGRKVVIIFFGAKVFVAVLLAGAFFSVYIFMSITMGSLNISIIGYHFRYLIIITILLALAGFYAPDIWLRGHIAKRKEKICDGFPEALDLLVVCVEGGMGLDSAIMRVSEEMRLINKEISDEFQTLTLELRAGKSRMDALRNLALRTDLDEVKNLVTLLIQAEKFGTSVAQTLRVHSDFMRTKRYQRAEEKAAQIAVKLLFPLIFCIFPSLFITILGPAVIQLLKMKH